MPKKTTLESLIDAADRLPKPIPKAEEFHGWRISRNHVLHGLVKWNRTSPLLPPREFVELSEQTALRGVKLARLASTWEKKIKPNGRLGESLGR